MFKLLDFGEYTFFLRRKGIFTKIFPHLLQNLGTLNKFQRIDVQGHNAAYISVGAIHIKYGWGYLGLNKVVVLSVIEYMFSNQKSIRQWKDLLCSWINIVKMSLFPEAISIKLLMALLTEMEQTITKFVCNQKRSILWFFALGGKKLEFFYIVLWVTISSVGVSMLKIVNLLFFIYR